MTVVDLLATFPSLRRFSSMQIEQVVGVVQSQCSHSPFASMFRRPFSALGVALQLKIRHFRRLREASLLLLLLLVLLGDTGLTHERGASG